MHCAPDIYFDLLFFLNILLFGWLVLISVFVCFPRVTDRKLFVCFLWKLKFLENFQQNVGLCETYDFLLDSPMSQELASMVLVGLFQLRVCCDLMPRELLNFIYNRPPPHFYFSCSISANLKRHRTAGIAITRCNRADYQASYID